MKHITEAAFALTQDFKNDLKEAKRLIELHASTMEADEQSALFHARLKENYNRMKMKVNLLTTILETESLDILEAVDAKKSGEELR